MRAMVTGANGFVGQYLISSLEAAGHEAVAVCGPRLESGREEISIDLMDETALDALELQNVDAVFHLAGLASVEKSFDQPRQYIDVNSTMQINLFEAARKQNASPRFIIISSGTLYSPVTLPLTEESPTSPGSPYAVSKLAQENLASYYSKLGFEVIIARPFNHIGPAQQPGFLVADLAKQIAEIEQTPNHTLKVGNLSSKRDYTDVRDITTAYVLLAEKGSSGEIYNVCSGKSIAGKEILDILLAISGRDIKTEIDRTKMRPSDNPDLYGDATKIREATGWQPQISLKTTLEDTLDYWRKEISA